MPGGAQFAWQGDTAHLESPALPFQANNQAGHRPKADGMLLPVIAGTEAVRNMASPTITAHMSPERLSHGWQD